ncbi:hypothetical protein [Glaciecola sp. 1036]|uniref:hypothetical protein n=1 Tax=Alteromonadaceae TaxID=72275 RepID=UPI003D0707CB
MQSTNQISAKVKAPGVGLIKMLKSGFEFGKHLLLIALIFIAAKVCAQEAKMPEVETAHCPSVFNAVNIPQDGKLCQVFAADYPASMIFFVPKTPEEVVSYYQQNESFKNATQVKDRFMLQSEDKNTTLIISKDGGGTQVDILVKSQA